MLANIFTTPKGRAAMQDPEKARSIIDFCNLSFTSCNPKVTEKAALVLFNYLLAFENQRNKDFNEVFQQSVVVIGQVLEPITDKMTLLALLLCECRLLFKNHTVVSWVEDSNKAMFCEQHAAV